MTHLSDSKRDAILEAASRMFLAHGYVEVSMDAIAEAAPVSKPTLYNYFDGKSALFEAVIRARCDRLLAALDAVDTSAGDFETGLREMARTCVDVIYEPGSLELFRVLIAGQMRHPDLGPIAYRSSAEPIIERIASYLRKAERGAGFAFRPVKESARVLISLLMGDEHFRCLLGVQPPPSARERVRLVNRVLPHYLKAFRE